MTPTPCPECGKPTLDLPDGRHEPRPKACARGVVRWDRHECKAQPDGETPTTIPFRPKAPPAFT